MRWNPSINGDDLLHQLHNKKLTPHAQSLRKNMTKEERHLWYDLLRQSPLPFYRQKVLGPSIVDFYCAKAKLIIELDGSQHYTEEGRMADQVRDAALTEMGYRVLRYSNDKIHHAFADVCRDIEHHILPYL